MKVGNKGKVRPSPSGHSLSPADNTFAVFKLLPAAILVLVSVLSLQDREVLAFLVTRSLKSSTPSFLITGKKNQEKTKLLPENQHTTPSFDCDCFNCYTSYWYKWDTSSNREIITQAIEAFDDHLNNYEQFKKNNRVKKKDKMGRRQLAGKSAVLPEISLMEKEPENVSGSDSHFVQVGPEKALEMSPEELPEGEQKMVVRSSTEISHKGLARKVLPDIMGLFISRLWNLWSSNV